MMMKTVRHPVKDVREFLGGSMGYPRIYRMVCPTCGEEFNPNIWTKIPTRTGFSRTETKCPYRYGDIVIDSPSEVMTSSSSIYAPSGSIVQSNNSSCMLTPQSRTEKYHDRSHYPQSNEQRIIAISERLTDAVQQLNDQDTSIIKMVEKIGYQVVDIQKATDLKIRYFETNDVYEVNKRIERLELKLETFMTNQRHGHFAKWLTKLTAILAVINLITLFILLYGG